MEPLDELVHFQELMKTAVLTGSSDPALVKDLVKAGGVPVAQRLNIHHNNFRETLTTSLAGVFSTLEAFVGPAFLKGALGEFCLKHPPKDASLAGYGAMFGPFLAEHKASEQVPYAADIAELEWALHELQLVNEQEVQEAVSAASWEINPNTRIISSEYPLLGFWSVANGHLPPEAISLDQGGQTVAVLLASGEVSLIALSPAEADALEEIAEEGIPAYFSEISDEDIFKSLNAKKIIVSPYGN